MVAQIFNRKLAAILHADVKGYCRLMGEDEEATISTVTTCMEVMGAIVIKHRGRAVSSAGDSLLAEFISVVDAVQCAVEIQDALKTENAELSEDRKVVFRIGINLGDVVEKDGDLLGDGVNIAARVEALADGGGICITRSVYDLVKKKLNLGYEYLGEHSVKNIVEPVRVYRVLRDPDIAGNMFRGLKTSKLRSKKFSILVFALLVLVTATAIWHFYPQRPGTELASIKKLALKLPDQPSIAVLPFDNMSGDPNQEYFSDGITEHIITSLSKLPYIFVIARNSTFAYKGRVAEINQIAKELGVKYVLEGSVQRSNDQVRITARLIDATIGHHLWAENYDRPIKDIFALQDEIAMEIMAAMQIKISVADLGRLSLLKTTNIKAYEKSLKAWEHLRRRTEEDILQVRQLCQEAIELDPEYGDIYLMMGWTHLDDIWFYRTKSREKSLETAEQFAQKAILLSADKAATHRLVASIHMLRKEYDLAIEESQKSVDLAPNSAIANFILGMVLRNAGRYSEAITFLRKAIRLDPITPVNYLNNLAWAHTYLGEYEKAVPLWNKALGKNPDYLFAHTGLAVAHQLLGHEEKSKRYAAEVLRIKPKISVEQIGKRVVVKDKEDKKQILEALRKAGIPE